MRQWIPPIPANRESYIFPGWKGTIFASRGPRSRYYFASPGHPGRTTKSKILEAERPTSITTRGRVPQIPGILARNLRGEGRAGRFRATGQARLCARRARWAGEAGDCARGRAVEQVGGRRDIPPSGCGWANGWQAGDRLASERAGGPAIARVRGVPGGRAGGRSAEWAGEPRQSNG